MDLNEQVATRIRTWIDAWPRKPEQDALSRVLKFLSQWRSILLANTYLAREGAVVSGGLFAGMRYLERPSQGILLPRLLGLYEADLRPHLEAFLADGLDTIIDVGCAEGYYAVGLALIAPGVTVHARDIDANARSLCAELAQRNGVADRVLVGGEFKAEDFAAFAGARTLVMVDTEGAELEILDPAKAPALADMPIIVETHGFLRPGAEETLVSRFSATHEITRVLQAPHAFDPPEWMREFDYLDLLLSQWDARDKPTPWLVMRPRAKAGDTRAPGTSLAAPIVGGGDQSPAPQGDPPLPVVFALNNASGTFWLNTAVALTSVAQHARGPIALHVLHDDSVSEEVKHRLREIGAALQTPLTLTRVEAPELPPSFTRHFGPACVFRLMIPRLFPEAAAVLYLDSDLVSNGVDVTEIAAAAPANAAISAVPDPYIAHAPEHRLLLDELQLKAEDYFNSGVLLIRPPLLNDDLLEGCIAFSAAHPNALHPDQDFLNFHFAGRWAPLDARFNYQVGLWDQMVVRPLGEFAGKIIHYAGKVKPLSGHVGTGLIPFLAHAYLTPEIIHGQSYEISTYLFASKTNPHGVEGRPLQTLPRKVTSS